MHRDNIRFLTGCKYLYLKKLTAARGAGKFLETEHMFENAKTGMKHIIPLSTNFKLFKYLSLSTSANFEEVWTQNTINYNEIFYRYSKLRRN